MEEKLGAKAIFHPIIPSPFSALRENSVKKLFYQTLKVINNEQFGKFCHIFSQFFAIMVIWYLIKYGLIWKSNISDTHQYVDPAITKAKQC